jgi:hypothetical protein
MAGVIAVLRDAAGALDYAINVLEAPPRASIRDTARELKEARYTVAAMLDALELARDRLEVCNYGGEEDDALARMDAAITKAIGGLA